MKLLIVEDEVATRNGLVNNINWEGIGIAQVIAAENGSQGLAFARRYHPDIVLTDIRMPHMDGVEMARRIREADPSCPILFLSAYSDIDYYKAAILLKAVNYIEKPVQPSVLEATMRQAVEERRASRKIELTVEQQRRYRFEQAAFGLTRLGTLDRAIQELDDLDWWSANRSHRLVTTILLLFSSDYQSGSGEIMADISGRLETLGRKYQFQHLCALRHDDCVLIQLFSTAAPAATALEEICRSVMADNKLGLDFLCASAGRSVFVEAAFDSYNSAAHLLQTCFYYPRGEILVFDRPWEPSAHGGGYKKDIEEISLALDRMDLEQALRAAVELTERLRKRKDLLVIQAKKIYTDLIMALVIRASESNVVLQLDAGKGGGSFLEGIESCNLDMLHEKLEHAINEYFSGAENVQSEQRCIFLIKSFIYENYSNDMLYIKDIADHIHMSASHVSALFKKGTGQTLSQFITDYRISKAKKYLRETGMSVAEIGEKVGYKDNNYFGRIFRKTTGLTPLEYRDEKLV